jgi:hypothetical protein
VPADDPSGEWYFGYQWDYSANEYRNLWFSYLTPGETDWWGVNPNPAWLSTPATQGTTPWQSTFFAQLGEGTGTTELDLATNWNVCGGQGQVACPGGGCGDETQLTDIGGVCVPIESRTFSCDNEQITNLYGNWSLTISNTGAWGFFGGIESTGGFATNYGAGLALSATNASGQNYEYGQSGTVADHDNLWGTSIPSSNSFNSTGVDPSVPGRWSEIANASATCGISDSANLGDDILGILADTGIGVAAVGPVLLTGVLLTQAGPNQTCTTPEPGVTRCEFN